MENKNIMRESYIEKRFVKMCKEKGMKAIKMIPTYENGIPDRQVLYKGKSGFAELKAPGKHPDPLQVVYADNLRRAGFFVASVDSIEGCKKWISDFLQHESTTTYCAICGNKNILS